MKQYSPHQNVVNYNAGGKQDRLLLGIVLMVAGESLLVTMGAVIKHISVDVSLVQTVFLRNFLALAFLFPLVYRVGLNNLKTQNIKTHLLRGVFGLSAMYCMFYSFSNIKLSEAVLLKATSPIMLALMAWLILREKLPILAWCAIFMAFLGVVIITNPSAGTLNIELGYIAGISSALLAALAKIMVRKLGRTEASEVIVFYFAVFGTVLTLPLAIIFWQSVSLVNWGFFLMIAVLASFGQLFITKAYTVAKAGMVSVFSYLSMPIAGALGWLVWQESYDLPLLLGTTVVICAGAMIFYVNQRD